MFLKNCKEILNIVFPVLLCAEKIFFENKSIIARFLASAFIFQIKNNLLWLAPKTLTFNLILMAHGVKFEYHTQCQSQIIEPEAREALKKMLFFFQIKSL